VYAPPNEAVKSGHDSGETKSDVGQQGDLDSQQAIASGSGASGVDSIARSSVDGNAEGDNQKQRESRDLALTNAEDGMNLSQNSLADQNANNGAGTKNKKGADFVDLRVQNAGVKRSSGNNLNSTGSKDSSDVSVGNGAFDQFASGQDASGGFGVNPLVCI